eukprot:s757_g4.t1
MIAQAWNQHENDRKLISKSSKEVFEVLQVQWLQDMEKGLNEAFVSTVNLSTKKPLVSEVYTHTQRVSKEAARRGHKTGTALSLETGFNFLLEADRERAKKIVKEERPFFLMIAFPCGPFSPLLRLNSKCDLARIQAEGEVLLKFALELADIQVEGGRHYMLENPQPSGAWTHPEMTKFLDEHDHHLACFHQCRFGLRGAFGLHRKATKTASSSWAATRLLDGKFCTGDHTHQPVIGGKSVTTPAGHYPHRLAKLLVDRFEKQFDIEYNQVLKPKVVSKSTEVLAVEEFDLADDDDESLTLGRPAGEDDSASSDEEEKPKMKISAGLKAAIKRNAAKHHKCDICQERRQPKTRRPASLPAPKDAGDQANIDLIDVYDSSGTKFTAIHIIDYATRFQLAELLPRKTAANVISFLKKRWLPVFGCPRTLVADQGREFISHELAEFCAGHSILLWHCGVGAPWQNGVCERAGGTLRVILAAMVNAHQVQGFEELEEALGEAVGAYNSDINELGSSPAQAALGRQPRMTGDVLGSFSKHLSEHGLIDSNPSMARQLALRETAKVTMTRLHFSRSIRRSELARSRASIEDDVPEPGAIAYFWHRFAIRDMTQSGIPDAVTGAETPEELLQQQPQTPLPSAAVEPLPDVQPSEFVAALQGGQQSGEGLSSMVPTLSGLSRDTPSAAPGTPVPDLILQARPGIDARMQPLLSRARALEEETEQTQGEKRPPDVAIEELYQQTSDARGSEDPLPGAGPSEALQLDANEVLEAASMLTSGVHPLLQLQALAELDRRDPDRVKLKDHGTWDGRWACPMVSDWKTRSTLGLPWPTGRQEFEVDAVQAARKEYFWRNMTAEQKKEFKKAAGVGWSAWVNNEAVEVLSPEETKLVWRELKRKNETFKVLYPRYVYTDKNDGARTVDKDLPILASARLVVPGFRDVTSYTIRKDAPTACRNSQHLLLIFTSCFYHKGWRLLSADVKAAFLKGDAYIAGLRELYIANIRTNNPDEPRLPFGEGLCRVRKGVFGLSDAPRQWFLRLSRALEERGWKRSHLDAACWTLRDEHGELCGIICSHVDDLLLGGNVRAQEPMADLGKELGFGSLEKDSFTYCGKHISQDSNGVIRIQMLEYHKNLKPAIVAVGRRKEVNSPLTPAEAKQLRALLGSMQWLVAQLRFDLQFQLSTLQTEPHVVSTLLKANMLVKKFKEFPDFSLKFKPFDLTNCGIVVVSDASLGNVTRQGNVGEDPFARVCSQSAYYVLVADEKVMKGEQGNFAVLDARSHRISRVCRSTFAAELYSTEEALDVGTYCRGALAELQGKNIKGRMIEAVLETIPMAVVTDSKDCYDKGTSDTPSFGSQKSLCFSIAWIRTQLAKERTELKWTNTENMFVDCGTKEMSAEHVHRILSECRWSFRYSPDFVKQTIKSKKGGMKPAESLPTIGEPLDSSFAVFHHLLRLGDQFGWHLKDDMAIQVAKDAKSYRTPVPRFNPIVNILCVVALVVSITRMARRNGVD